MTLDRESGMILLFRSSNHIIYILHMICFAGMSRSLSFAVTYRSDVRRRCTWRHRRGGGWSSYRLHVTHSIPRYINPRRAAVESFLFTRIITVL
ncbi:hypothetical protein EJ04DRAFT_120272 [Polyplosphaeria fusca]|uniref:Uncharacterized protein n=1 Tax=Polyplosphaeria fusca TaxID=682080 RepID=A0A9P4QIL7_9PLEO|nr:hypothetical protein EJ04DRAFT_120272 [Polyplosphaeria fusca]